MRASDAERALAVVVLVAGAISVLFNGDSVFLHAKEAVTGRADLEHADGIFELEGDAAQRVSAAKAELDEVTRTWALPSLAITVAYLGVLIAMMICAVFVLRSGAQRRRLGLLAIAAVPVRLVEAVISMVFMAKVAPLMMRMAVAGHGKDPRFTEERMEGVTNLALGWGGALAALGTTCWTLMMCGLFAGVAIVFLKAQKTSIPVELAHESTQPDHR